MLMGFFSWWYGAGWKQVADSFKPRAQAVIVNFSVRQLLPTLFAPWRRIVTPPGRALDDKLRALLDNLVSRVIGFVVRIGVLLVALMTLLGITVLTLVELLLWPVLPLAGPLLLIWGLLE